MEIKDYIIDKATDPLKPMKEQHRVLVENPKAALGAKRVPIGLLPAAGIIGGAEAMEFGAYHAGPKRSGYGAYNFRDSAQISFMMYLDALERHILRLRDGEDLAPDSKLHHLKHIVADASIGLDALSKGNMKDDRPSKGKAAELLDAFENDHGRDRDAKNQAAIDRHPAHYEPDPVANFKLLGPGGLSELRHSQYVTERKG